MRKLFSAIAKAQLDESYKTRHLNGKKASEDSSHVAHYRESVVKIQHLASFARIIQVLVGQPSIAVEGVCPKWNLESTFQIPLN